jgi:hypothetical protein
MFNLKWCGIAAGFGFLLSLLMGMVSGAGLFWAFARALIFGAVFFALAGGIRFLVDRFLPDLLSAGENGAEFSALPGSRVDISVGDDQEDAVLSTALPDDSMTDGEPGNIADLLNGNIASRVPSPAVDPSIQGMDQKEEDGYTGNRESGFQSKVSGGAPGTGSGEKTSAPSPGGLRPAEGLPDLDSMAEVFQSREDGGAEPASDRQSSFGKPVGRQDGKGQSMAGDFNPKDLASAIQTILSKD